MKNRLCKYDIELFNEIIDAKDFPNIIGTYNNKLDSLWCRNHKNTIKVQTSIFIKGVKPNCGASDETHMGNVYFDITPKQAKEIIFELQKTLKRRKK